MSDTEKPLLPNWVNRAMADQARAGSDRHERLWGERLPEMDELADAFESFIEEPE